MIRLYSWLLEWLDTTQMVMVVQKQQILNITITPNNICYYNFPIKTLIHRGCLIMLLSWLLEWLDTTQMVLAVWKHLSIIDFIVPNKSCYWYLTQNSIPKG